MCARIVIPATQEVYLQCIEEGSDQDLHSRPALSFPRRPAAPAWAVIWASWRTASAAVSTTNRNFVGRMGHVDLGDISGKPGRRCRKRSSRLYLRTGRPEVREETHTMNAKGKVFKYGDNVDTDVIIPARYLNIADPKELATHCNGGHRRGFRQECAARATSLSAARNFGCGSSREHAPLVHPVRTAFPALSRPRSRVSSTATPSTSVCRSSSARRRPTASTHGDEVEVDFDTGVITDVTKGESWQAAAFPPFIQNIITGGRPAQVAQGERGIKSHGIQYCCCQG